MILCKFRDKHHSGVSVFFLGDCSGVRRAMIPSFKCGGKEVKKMATSGYLSLMRSILLLIVVCFVSLRAYAKYSGGMGQSNDPFQIATAEDLMLLGESPEDYDKHFILTADINLDPNLPGRKVFDKAVIAPDTDPVKHSFQGTSFNGFFDGNGHTILHLTITGQAFLGLFGQLGSGAKISDLGLEAVNVRGTGFGIGGLVGDNAGSIATSYSTGEVTGTSWVGGLVGNNFGDIDKSCSTSNVTGNDNVGGLAGGSWSDITNSYSTGTVEGIFYVGGLLGENRWTGSISGSYSTSIVTGNSQVGGLVGFNWNSIATSYTSGTVIGDELVGGLVGRNGGSIDYSFSTSTVTGEKSVGGLVGFNSTGDLNGGINSSYSSGMVNGSEGVGGLVGGNDGIIITSFWDVETSGQTTSDGGMGKTTAEMQRASTFLGAGWDFVDETANGTEDIWWILEGQSYPRLWWQYGRAFSPHPHDGAFDVAQPLLLSWLSGGSSLYHDIYFGEDKEAVASATTKGAGVYCGRQAAEITTYDPGLLKLGKTYYWRIDEVNETDPNSPLRDNVWSFTTADFLVVDDFESYDDDDNPIWNTWMDGWINGTGSCLAFLLPPWIGIDPPTHNGVYSMPFGYNNADPPYYSEAYRTWQVPQDWTMGGCSHLSLWVRGEPVSLWEKPDQTVVMSGYGSEREDTRAYGFVHKSLNGDGEIVARIDSLNKAEDWVRAGVMIRANLEQDSPYAVTTITGSYGICFTHCMGGKSEGIPTTNTGPQVPHSVKLTRHGGTFTAQHSVDGVTWQDVTDVEGKPITVIVPMPQKVYIGLCVSGPGWWPWGRGAATAVFSNITITGHVTGTWEVAEQGYWYNPTNSIDNLYVALQDSGGRMGTVIHSDPMAVIVTEWRHWKIPLSAFTSTGVDPMAIKRIYIGVGDRDNPQPNGTGWIHIDDICLTNQMPQLDIVKSRLFF